MQILCLPYKTLLKTIVWWHTQSKKRTRNNEGLCDLLLFPCLTSSVSNTCDQLFMPFFIPFLCDLKGTTERDLRGGRNSNSLIQVFWRWVLQVSKGQKINIYHIQCADQLARGELVPALYCVLRVRYSRAMLIKLGSEPLVGHGEGFHFSHMSTVKWNTSAMTWKSSSVLEPKIKNKQKKITNTEDRRNSRGCALNWMPSNPKR